MTTRRVLVQLNALSLGGTQINAVQFAAQVRQHGYDSVLVGPRDTLPDGPSLLDVAAEYGLEITAFDRPTSTLTGAHLFDRMARDAKADIVHVYSQGQMSYAWFGPCRFGQRPLVITAYEMSLASSPWCLDGPPLVVGTKYLEEDHSDRAGDVTLISPPVDMVRDRPDADAGAKFRASHGLDPGSTLVVWVGRLVNDMKAVPLRALIDAMEILDSDDAVLAIVGGAESSSLGCGDAEPELRDRARCVNERMGREAVRLVGALADPHGAYAAADVVVGMGSSAARGLATGVPLVAVGEFGWSRVFDEQSSAELYRNSFWSDEVHAEAATLLAEQLRPLLANAELRQRLGAYGREFAEANFGLAAMGQRLAGIYDRADDQYGLRGWAIDLADHARLAGRSLARRFSPLNSANKGRL